MKPDQCRICQSNAEKIHSSLPGFQAPKTYTVYECSSCDSRYTWPLAVEESVYELIYKNSQYIPGYDRYNYYSRKVLSEESPLDYLKKSEDVYYYIGKFIEDNIGRSLPDTPSFLEVGCGMGYLTYSLIKAGYQAKGIDISLNAVNEAIEKYGDYYEQADLYEWSRLNAKRYDVVICTEVIEHIPDPVSFLAALLKLLNPGGFIVLTTPNRSVFSPEVLWHTDPPPIHLWWFSESSLRIMAYELNCSISFLPFSSSEDEQKYKSNFTPTKPPTFDMHGHILDTQGVFNRLIHNIIQTFPSTYRWITYIYINSILNKKKKFTRRSCSLSLCAVFSPKQSTP